MHRQKKGFKRWSKRVSVVLDPLRLNSIKIPLLSVKNFQVKWLITNILAQCGLNSVGGGAGAKHTKSTSGECRQNGAKETRNQIRYFANLLFLAFCFFFRFFFWSKVIENAVANYKWQGDSCHAAACTSHGAPPVLFLNLVWEIISS